MSADTTVSRLYVKRLGRVPGVITAVGYADRLYVGTRDGVLYAVDGDLVAHRVRSFDSAVIFVVPCEADASLLVVCRSGDGVVIGGRGEKRVVLGAHPKCRPVFVDADVVLAQRETGGIVNVMAEAAESSFTSSSTEAGCVLLGGLLLSPVVVFYGEDALLHVYAADRCRGVRVRVRVDGLPETVAITAAARPTAEIVAFGTDAAAVLIVRVADVLEAAKIGKIAEFGSEAVAEVSAIVVQTRTATIRALVAFAGGVVVSGGEHVEHVAAARVSRVCVLDAPSVGGHGAIVCTEDGDIVEMAELNEDENDENDDENAPA